MHRLIFFLLCCLVTSAQAQERTPEYVVSVAHQLFPDMPDLKRVRQIEGKCGADHDVNEDVAYCTTQNVILYRTGEALDDRRAYGLVHVLGHAVQVRHGIADIALREIRRRPHEESRLRGWVTRQAECIAGAIYARTELPQMSLLALYSTEPMTDSHWGRDPLKLGPKVSIGRLARAMWFDLGYEQGFAVCNPGEFSADLILEALVQP